jgi:RNA polymerase sigma-70 factor (ECF subfamily)
MTGGACPGGIENPYIFRHTAPQIATYILTVQLGRHLGKGQREVKALPQKARSGPALTRGNIRLTKKAVSASSRTTRSPSKSATATPTSKLSDLDLIEGIKLANEVHFNELYNRYFQRIYNFVYGRIRNHADTEEIVQETFAVVFLSIKKYSGRSSLVSWVYGIARNTTNNNLRQTKTNNLRMQKIGHDHLQPTKNISSWTPEEHLAIQGYLSSVVDQLEGAGDWQLEIFEMRHLQNLSIREISERTQRSSDSVRSSLYRVKRLLTDTARLNNRSAESEVSA